jgi:hypothetical protein
MRTELTMKPLRDIIDNYQIPELQRLVDNGHIVSMVEDQKSEYDKYKSFSMLQSFTIAYIVEEKKGYILDGQHRVEAYSRLKREGYDIDNILVPIVKYNVGSIEEVNEYFKKINKHSPIKPILNLVAVEKIILQCLVDRFTTNYFKGDYSDSIVGNVEKNYQCPHISLNDLGKHIKARNIVEKLGNSNKTDKDLFNYILSVNDYLESISAHQLDPTYTKRFEKCKNKKEKERCNNVCYLGVFKNYEWLDLALHALINSLDISSIGMKFFQDVLAKNDRKTIPYELKKRVWNKYNNNDMIGKCYVCDKKLDIKDMECGHIIAHALGGEITLNNLQPTCKTCNRDMGVMNLNEYKQLFK